MNILVYDGPGVTSLQRILLKSLNSLLKGQYDVIPIEPAKLRSDPWEESTKLLIMPGGRDLAFLSSLQDDGIQKLKNYVENGGRYLGICGGAYLACKSLKFEVGRSDYEVQGDRPLKFCDAVAIGSIAKEFIYNTELGTRAMKIYDESNKHELSVYVNGGPYFEFDSIDSNTNILYRYGLNQKPCIVDCKVGQGQAILSGCHFEVSAEYIKASIDAMKDQEKYADEKANLEAIYPILNASEHDRNELFKNILIRLGLSVSNDTDQNMKASPVFTIATNDSAKMRKFYSDLESMVTDKEEGKVEDSINTWLIPKNDYKIDEIPDLVHLLEPFHDAQVVDSFQIKEYLGILDKNHCIMGSFLIHARSVGSTQTTIDK